MNKDQVKELIVSYVREVEGCKVTDLITDLPIRQTDHKTLIALGEFDLSILVTELVKENKLIEIGYLVPLSQSWLSVASPEEITEKLKKQERSFIVPAGCEIVIKGVQKN